MILRNFFIIILVMIVSSTDCIKYSELKKENNVKIKKSDLPEEFSKKALKTVDDFIKKTHKLDYEVVLYFDYITGEILSCSIGIPDNVKLKFNPDDYKDKNVASIHNHPQNVFSPPSDKNFGILQRDFEDYELIAGINELWILKAKGVDMGLCIELKLYSGLIMSYCQNFCEKHYGNSKKAMDICEERYGTSLSKYINEKNLNNIQLVKKEINHDCN